MVEASGYLKMIDMGTAKFLKQKGSGEILRTFTVLGSPHYLAPEILEGFGYSFMVDIYSLGTPSISDLALALFHQGVCYYEMVCGTLPFGEDLADPFEIYQ